MTFSFLNKNKKNINSIDFINKDCYLIKSNVIDKETINSVTMESYNEFLLDDEIPKFLKDHINFFLIPYKISMLKFSLNSEYYKQPYPVDLVNNHSYIAPSLVKIKESNYFDIPPGYSELQIISFPDVVWWAMNEGKEIMRRKISHFSEEELIENNHFSAQAFNVFIEQYLISTHKALECMLY